MPAKVIDGVALSRETRARCGKRQDELRRACGVTPRLAVIAVGADPASRVYVRNKRRSCAEVGLHCDVHEMRDSSSEAELLESLRKLNADSRIHGTLIQLPLPAHIATDRAMQAIAPEKDVDGFHPVNVGLLAIGNPRFSPRPNGRHAVILGRSDIVGKPVAMLLLQRDATVSVCHSKTPDVAALTRQADILVVAVGRPAMVTGDMVKEGAIVIDVGINRRSDGSIVGDVEFASAANRASHITPVPGGMGPMTIAMLLLNTISAAELAAAGR